MIGARILDRITQLEQKVKHQLDGIQDTVTEYGPLHRRLSDIQDAVTEYGPIHRKLGDIDSALRRR